MRGRPDLALGVAVAGLAAATAVLRGTRGRGEPGGFGADWIVAALPSGPGAGVWAGIALVAGAVGVRMLLGPTRPAGALSVALGMAGVVCLLVGGLVAFPHSALLVVVVLVQAVRAGESPFPFVTPGVEQLWALGGNVLPVALAAAASLLAVRDGRRVRGRCGACGRFDARPPAVSGRRLRALRWTAAAAVLGALPYAGLKLAWGAGARWGMRDGLGDATFGSPGFGDTVLLSAVSVVVCVAVAARPRRRWVRHSLTTVLVVGAGMLLPIGVLAMVDLLVGGGVPTDDPGLDPWVYLLVYTSFFAWGWALTVLATLHLLVSRDDCRRHEVHAGPPWAGATSSRAFAPGRHDDERGG